MKDIAKVFTVKNVVELLDTEELNRISEDAINGYESDEESRADWKDRNAEGMKLAMQISNHNKNFPFEDAANVMYPLISIAAMQFAARAYPNLITGWDIVKAKVVGQDPDGTKASRANRVQTHMNYQLNEEMVEWEEDTDRLFTVLPIVGCCFKKTYYSVNEGRPVSVYVDPLDVVVHYKAKSLLTVPRITERYNLYPNEIIERIRSGMFIDFEFDQPQEKKDEDEEYGTDNYRPHLFLEQHTWLDLDKDGYSEPYILNVHYDSKKVVRIVPRFSEQDILRNDKGEIRKINAKRHYTKYSFMPSPDGSIYDVGFGSSILRPINHTVNTVVNQILDAGTLDNCQGGFVGRGIGLGRGRTSGPIRLKINEWMPVNHSGDDLRKNIVPLPTKGPSAVLFNMLGFMVSAGEKLSSVTSLLMGEQTVHNEPATTSLARMEQGLKVFSAIHKRLHRSFTEEFKLIYKINAENIDEPKYFTILDDPKVVKDVYKTDYDKNSCDIIPTSSPEDVSNTQKLVKAQALMQLLNQGFNDTEIKRRYIEALQIPDQESIMQPEPQAPDPKIMLEMEKLNLEKQKQLFELEKWGVERAKIMSEIMKNIASAESEEAGTQINEYKAMTENLLKVMEARQNAINGGRLQGMVGQPGGGGGQANAQGQEAVNMQQGA